MKVSGEVTKAATCTEDGIGKKECSICDYTEPYGVLEKLGHSFIDNWGNSTATCTVAGNETRTCTLDCDETGHTETRDVSALGHDWNWNTYTSGSGLRKCQRSEACTVTAGIGDTGPGGGVIFYVASSGFTVQGFSEGVGGYTEWHFTGYTANYLEAAPSNLFYQLAWASSNDLIPHISQDQDDETDRAIGRGRRNSAAIVARGIGRAYLTSPALQSLFLGTGGKDDWFLPSRDELAELVKIRGQYGIPNSGLFWSSSQSDAWNAWIIWFSNGNFSRWPKSELLFVRPIRAF